MYAEMSFLRIIFDVEHVRHGQRLSAYHFPLLSSGTLLCILDLHNEIILVSDQEL
jgi:hypothetical protein